MDENNQDGRTDNWMSDLTNLINRKKEEIEMLKKLQEKINPPDQGAGESQDDDEKFENDIKSSEIQY